MTGKSLPYNVRAGSRYGAPMGRMDQGAAGDDGFIKLKCRRVPLAHGYDGGGAYWGSRGYGEMLFCIWSADRSVVLYRDATSYLTAQESVREIYPQADFL